MNKLDSLTWYIMDALADDWESIEQIRPHVHEFHGYVTDGQIFVVLSTLHKNQLVRIMDENGDETIEFPTEPSSYWFDMTNSGRSIWDAEGTKYRDKT